MKLTNKQICDYGFKLLNIFNNKNQLLPIKLNFYLQKNKNLIIDIATTIENERISILQKYGSISEENPNEYIFSSDKALQVQEELNNLYALEQDIDIHIIDINTVPDNVNLTIEQMEVILFMFE